MISLQCSLLIQYVLVGVITVESVYDVKPLVDSCSQSETTCEIWLEVSQTYTMVYADPYNSDAAPNSDSAPAGSRWLPVEATADGLRTLPVPESGSTGNTGHQLGRLLNTTESSSVITADGNYRMVYAVNGTLPGPALVVYAGQQIVLQFHNNLPSTTQTLHFHGMHNRGTPYMDGVAGVSQCPVGPGETFTYRFQADPVGTHWYHDHAGSGKSMGVHGAFVVKERSKEYMNEQRGDDVIPSMEAEYLLPMQDWMKEPADDIDLIISNAAMGYAGFFNTQQWPEGFHKASRNADGSTSGIWPFNSVLINGRGHGYGEDVKPINEFVPLSTYHVMKNKHYYFRSFSSSMIYILKISIDGHALHVVSADGSPVRTAVVDFITVAPGERFDFWIEACNPQNVSNYWIRVEFVEYDRDGNYVRLHHGEAILNYDNEPVQTPTSSRRECTASQPCLELNCPQGYAALAHTQCIYLIDLQSPLNDPAWSEDEDVQEIFVAQNTVSGSVLNGLKNIMTPYPTQVYAGTDKPIAVACDDVLRSNVTGACTNIIKIPLGQTVHLILFTHAEPGVEYPQVILHPMHIHGYAMQVVAMGFPTYDETGRVRRTTSMITCFNSVCSTGARWSNSTWHGRNIPGFKGVGAIVKDTVFVIPGGYTVLRFKADNPGFWLFHCHLEYHFAQGMALLLQVGELNEIPPTPQNMQRCGDFDQDIGTVHPENVNSSFHADHYYTEKECAGIVGSTVVLTLVCSVLLALLAAQHCHHKKQNELNKYHGRHYRISSKSYASTEEQSLIQS